MVGGKWKQLYLNNNKNIHFNDANNTRKLHKCMILKMEVLWFSLKMDSEPQILNLLKIYFKNFSANR